MANTSYIEQQMIAVAPLPIHEDNNGQFKMQIRSDRGWTNWLNITPEEFKAIEQLLLQRLDQKAVA